MTERSPSLEPEHVANFINRGTRRVEEGEEPTPEMITEVTASRAERYEKLDRRETRRHALGTIEIARSEIGRLHDTFYENTYREDVLNHIREELEKRMDTLATLVDPEEVNAVAEVWRTRINEENPKIQDYLRASDVQWTLWDEFADISERQRSKGISRASYVEERVQEMVANGSLTEEQAERISGDRKRAWLNPPRQYQNQLERNAAYLIVMNKVIDKYHAELDAVPTDETPAEEAVSL